MSFEPLKWVNRDKEAGLTGTKINADNMNHIENGISDLNNALSTISSTS